MAECVDVREVFEDVVAVELEERREVEHDAREVRDGQPDSDELQRAVGPRRDESEQARETEVEERTCGVYERSTAPVDEPRVRGIDVDHWREPEQPQSGASNPPAPGLRGERMRRLVPDSRDEQASKGDEDPAEAEVVGRGLPEHGSKRTEPDDPEPDRSRDAARGERKPEEAEKVRREAVGVVHLQARRDNQIGHARESAVRVLRHDARRGGQTG